MSTRAIHHLEVAIGDQILRLETGRLAHLASASIHASMGGTHLLVTVASQAVSQKMKDSVPLSVFYNAPFYAVGRLPGGFNKREGKASDQEVIEARLIDRSIRPLFPKDCSSEIQVVVKCLAYDGKHEPSNFAITAVSAALRLSGLPFKYAIAGVRIGQHDGQWLLNPNIDELKSSALDLVMAGSETGVLMMEGQAHELTEEVINDAREWGQNWIQKIIAPIEAWTSQITERYVAKPHQPSALQLEIEACVAQEREALASGMFEASKKARQQWLHQFMEAKRLSMQDQFEKWGPEHTEYYFDALLRLHKEIVRSSILDQDRRLDGRSAKDIRPVSAEVSVFPHHGSALFNRGETQALGVITLGSDRDAQVVDDIYGNTKDRFMVNYNFYPYSVGECGMMGAPKRREIGHGRLARKALMPLLPKEEEFPYVIRAVSEILACNGSSSMASVCVLSLALMDAGVPLRAAVAGIAMGVVVDEQSPALRYRVLSDILGDEDGAGHMDMKVAGTRKGITAIQMDIKLDQLDRTIFLDALKQAHEGRMHILDTMDACLAQPKENVSNLAPKVFQFNIAPEKIRDVIGKGGAVIKELCERYQVSIDISEQGAIRLGAVNAEKGEEAKQHILSIVRDIEVGHIYEGTVIKMMDFGAFVNLLPGKDGFLHISEISSQRVTDIHEHIKKGQVLRVKVLEIDAQKRIRLTIKDLEA